MLYSTSPSNDARFYLGTKGSNPLIVIGVNPSTATKEKSDNTISKVKKFASINKFDSWLMLNIYPQRATDPSNLHKKINESFHKQNLRKIKEIIGGYNRPTICAAWGNTIKKRDYLKRCLREIYDELKQFGLEWKTIGSLTKQGNPGHPLRLSYELNLKEFDIKEYLS